jgi:hypothetical protein
MSEKKPNYSFLSGVHSDASKSKKQTAELPISPHSTPVQKELKVQATKEKKLPICLS